MLLPCLGQRTKCRLGQSKAMTQFICTYHTLFIIMQDRLTRNNISCQRQRRQKHSLSSGTSPYRPYKGVVPGLKGSGNEEKTGCQNQFEQNNLIGAFFLLCFQCVFQFMASHRRPRVLMASRVGTFQLSSLTTLHTNNIKFCRENYNCNSFEI